MGGLLFAYGLPSVAHAGGAIHVYQCDDRLRANKSRIADGCRDLAATEEQTRLIIAVAMAETNNCCCTERDAGKDCTPSANYSCFNLNKDMLQLCGWHEGGVDLNNNENVTSAIAYILAAVRAWGLDSFLNFHRGGRTAWTDGTSYGAQEYRDAIHAVMEYLAANPSHLRDNWRIGFEVPHV